MNWHTFMIDDGINMFIVVQLMVMINCRFRTRFLIQQQHDGTGVVCLLLLCLMINKGYCGAHCYATIGRNTFVYTGGHHRWRVGTDLFTTI